MDWNSRINLTTITDLDGVQVRHFLDSLTVGTALLTEMDTTRLPTGFSLLDIGGSSLVWKLHSGATQHCRDRGQLTLDKV